MDIRLTSEAFDPQSVMTAFAAGRDDAGALVSFVGLCRAATDGTPVRELHIQQYEGFSRSEIARLAQGVAMRFDCPDLLVIHRVGTIRPGEAIVLVAALSIHRANAFDAVRVLMDHLKTDAPLWKKETGPDGARWIEPSIEDQVRRTQAQEDMA